MDSELEVNGIELVPILRPQLSCEPVFGALSECSTWNTAFTIDRDAPTSYSLLQASARP